ncbi:IclR family transcriptional regulator [uncultured Paludibaculum sp.]|uniref:IclR family transcriptional regulator n=1 Tax=uncultured Paludibaculum sp. TaxID=1765020 RepID=UPI002AABA145|nr:IclR family transcriptional regulator [uncultured Paludibaculum sp.]
MAESIATSKARQTSDDRYVSRGIVKAFEALTVLARSQSSLSVNELAARLDVTRSFAFRLMQTLESVGQVERVDDARYRLREGNHIGASRFVADLLQAAREPLRALSARFSETIGMSALFQNRIEVIHVIESPRLMRVTNVVGRILPPHASSMGKALTAHQPEAIRNTLIRNYGLLTITPNTITDQTQLEAEYARIRERSYAVDAEESIPDSTCFGVPVFLKTGEAIAAISVSFPTARLPREQGLDDLIQCLKSTSQAITDGL